MPGVTTGYTVPWTVIVVASGPSGSSAQENRLKIEKKLTVCGCCADDDGGRLDRNDGSLANWESNVSGLGDSNCLVASCDGGWNWA